MRGVLPELPGIVGLGIDLVHLARFSAFFRQHRDSLGEVFTTSELSAAAEHGSRELYLATRWACKEAVLKALGTGWGRGVQWTDVEGVGSLPAPSLRLSGAAARIARDLGAAAPIASVAWAGSNVMALAALVASAVTCGQGADREILPR